MQIERRPSCARLGLFLLLVVQSARPILALALDANEQRRVDELYASHAKRLLLHCQGEKGRRLFFSENKEGPSRVLISQNASESYWLELDFRLGRGQTKLSYFVENSGGRQSVRQETRDFSRGTPFSMTILGLDGKRLYSCSVSFASSQELRIAGNLAFVHLNVHPHSFYEAGLQISAKLDELLRKKNIEQHVLLEGFDVPYDKQQFLMKSQPTSESGLLSRAGYRDSQRSVTLNALHGAALHIAPTGLIRFDFSKAKKIPRHYVISGGYLANCMARTVGSLLSALENFPAQDLHFYLPADAILVASEVGYAGKLSDYDFASLSFRKYAKGFEEGVLRFLSEDRWTFRWDFAGKGPSVCQSALDANPTARIVHLHLL